MDDSGDRTSGRPARQAAAFEELLSTVERLRDPGGCPWDREQTHASLRPYLLEETYELLEAIDAGDRHGIAEELGDLLVHIAFHSDMARRSGAFTATDVLEGANRKLIRRHPHVFGNAEKLDSADEVVERWEELKRREKGGSGPLAESVPSAMPALAYAAAIQHRAERAGIRWRPPSGGPSGETARVGGYDAREQAAGERLFNLVAELRNAGVDAETSLRAAALRFRDRIARAEVAASGGALVDLDEAERARLWDEAGRAP